MKRSEGFTLIEVLIVVVIIAILASLILPRMTAMTKRAEAAEAMQTLGVLKRAGERYFDMLGDQNFSLEMGVDNSNCVG
ncbi:MAG TPA: prepilin-type N-terminal cleavage/methylation domain-containing protein, partial [Candidatus Omnitrophota bacterium]|nr:prepilin-type N-terminal cleavage/methylation domain-containing protein [Candidatus Omnitrophota bacterium]